MNLKVASGIRTCNTVGLDKKSLGANDLNLHLAICSLLL